MYFTSDRFRAEQREKSSQQQWKKNIRELFNDNSGRWWFCTEPTPVSHGNVLQQSARSTLHNRKDNSVTDRIAAAAMIERWTQHGWSKENYKKKTQTKHSENGPREVPQKKKVSIEKCWKMLKSGDSVSVLFMSVAKPDPFSLLALYRPIETRVWNVFLFASCKHTHIAHTLHYTRRSSDSAFSLFCHCDCPPHGRGQREIISYAQLLLLPQPNHFYAIFI